MSNLIEQVVAADSTENRMFLRTRGWHNGCHPEIGPPPCLRGGGSLSLARKSWLLGGHQLTLLECCKIGRAWDPRRDWCMVRKIAVIF
jgi:hypothetical protein